MPYSPSLPDIPGRSVSAYADPKGPGDARPRALQIVEEEGFVGKLHDKVALVTGGTNGLGLEIVRGLSFTGMTVLFTARDQAKGDSVKKQLQAEFPFSKLEVIQLDLGSLASVKKGVEKILSVVERLDILVANAGIAATPRGYTEDGFEQQFGVNYLSHFYLFQLLKPLLLQTASKHGPVRVVAVSSTSHTVTAVLPEDNYGTPNPNGKGYEPGITYAHSNTAKIWFCNEIERRYGREGIHAISLHPGGFDSGIMESSEPQYRSVLEKLIQQPHIQKGWMTPQQAASTAILAAIGKDYEGHGGFYMENCSISAPIPDDVQWAGYGFKSWAYDEAGEKKLWSDSLKMVGLEESASI